MSNKSEASRQTTATEDLLRLLIDTTPAFIHTETFRIFELEPKTKITTDLIAQRTHPDDRQAVHQLIERASSERTEFALEHRLLMPDGSIKYLRVVGRPSTDEMRPSEFVGAVTEITDYKRAEESLRESESYLAWGWGSRSAARSSRRTADACGPQRTTSRERPFNSPCPPMTGIK